MADGIEVSPRPGMENAGVTAPEETETPETEPAQPKAGQLPDALIQVPAMQALIAGNPPAVSAKIEEFASNPVAKLVVDNKDSLLKAGLGFYRSLNGGLGVIFNQFHIHGTELQAADKAGKLQIIAPSFDSVNQAVQNSGMTNPVLQKHSVPKSFAAPSLSAPPQFANTATPPAAVSAPPPASVPKKLATARIKNLTPGGPTSGASPGAGRILNQILAPVV